MKMGFFKKLGKVLQNVDQFAPVAASVLPGKAGQVAGNVATTSGVVTSIVQQIHAQSGSDLSPEAAQQQATLATAVAVDDHEERMKALEAELAALRAARGGQTGQTETSGSSGQSEASGTSETSGQTGTSEPSDTSGQS
jgi:hypothetical protein